MSLHSSSRTPQQTGTATARDGASPWSDEAEQAAAPALPRLWAAAIAWVQERRDQLPVPAILCLALLVRSYHTLREPFPLNDGGLFYQMARDLQASHYLLPAHTSYNGGEIPFAYSPLTLYLAALGDALTPASLEDQFRLLPLAGALFAVWAFWRLALVLLPTRNAALVATLAFALVPRSFIWLIMGGGLPRGFGLGLAILAIRQAILLSRQPASWRERDAWRGPAVLAGLAALTALTHLETAAFVALTCVLLIAFRPHVAWQLAAAGLGAIVVSAPWWATVVAYHGLDPFQASSAFSGGLLSGGALNLERFFSIVRNPVFTDEQFFPIFGALAVIGAFYAAARGLWFLPIWWVVITQVGMRAFPTYAAVVVALLAGLLITDLARVILASGQFDAFGQHRVQRRAPALVAIAAVALLFAVNGALEHARYDARFLRALPGADEQAFDWIAERVPDEAAFAVIPVTGWYADYASEWFPALAERDSVGTTQGYEWVEGAFADRLDIHETLRSCASSGAECVAQTMERTGATYVYVPSGCCRALARAILSSPLFDTLYTRDGVVIATRAARPGPRLPVPPG